LRCAEDGCTNRARNQAILLVRKQENRLERVLRCRELGTDLANFRAPGSPRVATLAFPPAIRLHRLIYDHFENQPLRTRVARQAR
jgi:hypothetical protein